MPVLPLAQLGYLFVRTIAKPVATAIKNRMKKHPKFKKGCLTMAQAYHRWERQMKVNMLGIKILNVQPLTEEKAIELGANMLSESILFTVAGALIYVDFVRRSAREKEKEANKVEAILDLQRELGTVKQLLIPLEQEHQELCHEIEKRYTLKSWNFFSKKEKQKNGPTISEHTPPTDQTIQKIISNGNSAVSSGMLKNCITNKVSAGERIQSIAESLRMKAVIKTEKAQLDQLKEEPVLDKLTTTPKRKPWYYRPFKWLISTVDDVLDDFNINEGEGDANMAMEVNEESS